MGKRDNEIIKRLYDISRDKLLFAIPPDVNTIAISIGTTDIINAQEEHKKLSTEDESDDSKHQNDRILRHIDIAAEQLKYMVEHLLIKNKKVLLLVPPYINQHKMIFSHWQSIVTSSL